MMPRKMIAHLCLEKMTSGMKTHWPMGHPQTKGSYHIEEKQSPFSALRELHLNNKFNWSILLIFAPHDTQDIIHLNYGLYIVYSVSQKKIPPLRPCGNFSKTVGNF